MGKIYVLPGNLTQALLDIEASIRLNTINPDTYGVRSHIRHKFGDILGAIAQFKIIKKQLLIFSNVAG